jgi:DNA-binding response OmpR family regulator
MIKVLLVDDDPELLEMVCLMLETSHLDPYGISNGKEVFKYIETVNPDILLMDIFLGDSDGRDICSQVKHTGKYSTLPVLLYSAGDISEQSIHISGANAFVKKPFDMSVLVQQIKTLTTITDNL